MASPLLWLEALAGLKALYDVIEWGVEYAVAFRRHREEADTVFDLLGRGSPRTNQED
jgi:hypothetical protein